MFRKMFVTCLALMLTLNMMLQAAPVLAQGKSTASRAGSQGILATIKNVSLLKGFPPRVRIDGAQPAGCTKLVVDKLIVGKPTPGTSITPITILVRVVRQPGVNCTTLPKSFKVTVTLDPFKLHLAPGHYLVRVNPRKGQHLNHVLFTIPSGLD